MKKLRAIPLLLALTLLMGCVSAKHQEVIPAVSFVRLYEIPPRAPSHNIYRGIRNGYAIIDVYAPEPTGSFAVFQQRYICLLADLPPDFKEHVKEDEPITITEPVRLFKDIE